MLCTRAQREIVSREWDHYRPRTGAPGIVSQALLKSHGCGTLSILLRKVGRQYQPSTVQIISRADSPAGNPFELMGFFEYRRSL